MRTRDYEAVFKSVNSLDMDERAAMARLYLTYYDNADEEIFFRDLDAKTEVDLLYCEGELVGFSTLLLYEAQWRGQTTHISFFTNVAEQNIRPAVLWKKNSFGVESERGGQYVEAMLSIRMTARLNGVNVAKYLRELISASRSKTPAPSIFSSPCH